jgi:flagellar protein FlbD
MIMLTRLSGTAFLLNADLIERVDSTPDTIITLIDGTKYVVAEPLEDVLAEVLDFRARIVAKATFYDSTLPTPTHPHPGATLGAGRLAAVPSRPAHLDRSEDR